MKRLIAVLLCVLLLFAAGCESKPGGNSAAITERETPLKYGINAHIYEQRPMDPSATMDYVADMTGILGVEYYRLSTPHDSMFSVGEGDTLTFKDGFKNLVHQIIEKMSAAGVKNFVAVSDAPINPYGYSVTSTGVVPDPAVEKETYTRWLKLYAKAWGMIAKEFPEVTYIEPMNEPDLPGTNMFTKQGHQWGADDGYKYTIFDKAHMIADLQYYIYKEVKAVNPDIKVTTPGFSTYGEGQDILDYIYEAIESGAHPFTEDFADTDPDHYFDCINFHKYLNTITLDEYFEQCDTFYKACERHGDAGKPAIITEWGFTDHDNEGQEQINGENMTKLLDLFNEKMPYLEAVIIYMLSDYYGYSVDTSEDNFGIFSSHGDPDKPSCPKPVAIEFYKYIHKTKDVSPLYKYCPELMPK
ncbi:MAG: cellulase family glycosylhydrolase [Clostridia bacterium]|nr:cellulase family glycosylhydrolase [Clostridia bacterium]